VSIKNLIMGKTMTSDIRDRARRFAKSGGLEIRLCANGVMIGMPYNQRNDVSCGQSDMVLFTKLDEFQEFLGEFFNGRERD
jgi:hypothetical protein